MGKLVLVTGGARSGKSAFALAEAEKAPAGSHMFVATAVASDDEMVQRIKQHQQDRGKQWTTQEAPLELAATLRDLPHTAATVVDCLTVWLGNVWHAHSADPAKLESQCEFLCESLKIWKNSRDGVLFCVSNEVGWGIVPHDSGVRAFRDAAGRLNQGVAAIADEVYLCVAGLPVKIKE